MSVMRGPIITDTGIADGAIGVGCAVLDSASSDLTAKHYAAATSGIASGIAASAATAANDQFELYLPGSACKVSLAASVTDLTVPLMATTGGKLTPCTTDNDAIVAWPLEKATYSSGVVLISARVAQGYYGLTGE